jgi:hypothetical protein
MKAQAGLFGSIAGAIASVIVAIIFLILGKWFTWLLLT